MTTSAVETQRRTAVVAETTRRRWRLAVLLGLVVLLALAAFVVVEAEQSAQANRTVAVLKAIQDIRAGTTITSSELGVAQLRVDDPSVVASLAGASERNQLVGQVSTDTIRAGSLIPAGLGAQQASAGMWEVPLPVKRMPPGLKAGDHVALLVGTTAKSGQPVDFVAMQDVRVIEIRSDSVDVWLPATQVAQMQWYADHGGGVIVAKMQPGAVQQNLPVGGGS
jgi:hypothetical protein